jgi:hypothetical protein
MTLLQDWEKHKLIRVVGSSWWWIDNGVSHESRAGLRRALRGENVGPKALLAMIEDGFNEEGYFDTGRDTI